MEVFENQEQEYAAWQAAHPHGFVLNHFGGTNPAYNVLHKSNCVDCTRFAKRTRFRTGLDNSAVLSSVASQPCHFGPLCD
jgi:hypothetical protein